MSEELLATLKIQMKHNIDEACDIYMFNISTETHDRIRMKACQDFESKIWIMEFDGTNAWIASTAVPTNNADHYTQVALWENLSVEKLIFEEDSA
jgi:hypothetical protein